MKATECPDPYGNPDDCAVCEGWGHRCTAFRASHSAEQVRDIETVYWSGWDPRRFYGSVPEALADGRRLAKQRKGH